MTDRIPCDPPAPLALALAGPERLAPIVAAWLDAKHHRSGSEKTRRAYDDTLTSFRAALAAAGLTLDGPPPLVALAAQAWAGRDEPAPATFNQRLAILSSFYGYAGKHRVLEQNPITTVERRTVQPYAGAEALSPGGVRAQLAVLKAGGTLDELRDYAVLYVALTTGRRVNELAALRWRDVRLEGERVTLTFPHAKGGKTMRDTLAAPVAKALLGYLHALYGPQLGVLAPDAAIWASCSTNPSKGDALTARSLQRISQARLGVHFHGLRHSFARAMEDAGGKVSEIQNRLGHSSLQTTGRYLAALRSSENTHAEALADLFG